MYEEGDTITETLTTLGLNADEMFELDKKTKLPATNQDGSFKAKTAHTLNPVPLILYDNVSGGKLGLRQSETCGLSSIAATVISRNAGSHSASGADTIRSPY